MSIFFKEKTGPPFAQKLLLVGIILSSLGSTIPLGNWIAEQDVAAAKQYCEDLIPQLEDYRRQHGKYPEQLEQVSDLRTPPRLLDGRRFYIQRGNEYELNYFDNSSLFGYDHVYDSERKQWRTRD